MTTPASPGVAPFATPTSRADGSAARVEEELKALSRRLSRLEASLDKVLAAVVEIGISTGMGDAGRVGGGELAGGDDGENDGGGEGVAANKRGITAVGVGGGVLQDGGSQLANEVERVSDFVGADEVFLVDQAAGKTLNEST